VRGVNYEPNFSARVFSCSFSLESSSYYFDSYYIAIYIA
jgi:hypothetical protein